MIGRCVEVYVKVDDRWSMSVRWKARMVLWWVMCVNVLRVLQWGIIADEVSLCKGFKVCFGFGFGNFRLERIWVVPGSFLSIQFLFFLTALQ